MIRRKTEALLTTQGPNLTFILLFLLTNAVLFWWGVIEEYGHVTEFRRYSSVIARGFGFALNLDIGIIFLFASRKFMTILRRTPLNLVFPFDEAMPKYHGFVGYICCAFGFLHGLFHVIPGVITAQGLTPLWSRGFGGWTFGVVTGYVLLIVFSIMIIALKAREKKFELFYWIHMGGAATFVVLVLLHGKLNGLLYTWRWFTAFLAVYLLDRCYRNWHEYATYAVVPGPSATGFGGDVLKLAVPKCFEYRAGQYADVMIPSISKTQWHPFTIASAPHEEDLTFFIKSTGGWTSQLHAQLSAMIEKGTRDRISVHVRGPYGAPAQHVGQFESVVLISGGVGSTPFCSIVKNTVHVIDSERSTQSDNASDIFTNVSVDFIGKDFSDSKSALLGAKSRQTVSAPPNVLNSESKSVRNRRMQYGGMGAPGESSTASDPSTSVSSSPFMSFSSDDFKNPVSFSCGDGSKNKSKLDKLQTVLRSLAVTYGALWLTAVRYAIALIVLITFHGIDVSEQGFRVFPKAFLIVDLVLSLIIAIPVVLEVTLDVFVSKQKFLFDILGTAPLLIAPIVFHILSLAGVASESWGAYPKVFFYFLFPATGIVICLRHGKRSGEFSTLAAKLRNNVAHTRSLDFIYTTPTSASDDWLVNELEPLSQSPHFRMHRFITRETKPDPQNWDGSESGIGRFENNYGRPNWHELFEGMVKNVPSGSSIGMFFCGPPVMENAVREAANAVMLGSSKRTRKGCSTHLKARGCGVRILVKAENF